MSGRQPGTMLIYEPGYYPEYSESLPGLPERPIDYDQIYQPLLDIGANYLGFGFNPWQAIETHEHHAAMLRRVMGRVGYRIRPAVFCELPFRGAPGDREMNTPSAMVDTLKIMVDIMIRT